MFRGILVRLRPVTLLIVVLAIALGSVPIAAAAQANRQAAPSGPPATTQAPPAMVPAGDSSNPYYSVRTITLGDGTQVDQVIINGPPEPPPGTELERAPVIPAALNQPGAEVSLPVPAYNWVFGCSAVSASMIGAYFDRNGLPNIYTGPGNGGVMPMDNSTVWGTWTDGYVTIPYPLNPLVASRNGLDGRASKGSIDDYWVKYDSTAQDPYITGPWTQHAWGDAFGDYMKTSQSAYGNTDGSTYFNWYKDGTPLTCAGMVSLGLSEGDGTYGRKLFYEARGYSVSDCYNRLTDNQTAAGFSFANYKAQIDAGYPVLLNLAGHSIVGIGYADPNTVYLNDTWDHATHTMTWGGSYSKMALESVSVVNPVRPNNPVPTITGLNPTSATTGGSAFTLTVNGTNFMGISVVRWNGSDRPTTYVSATQLRATIAAADIVTAGTASVSVFNPTPGGGTSSAVSFSISASVKTYLPLVVKNYPPSTWMTLVSTNFEGAWPSPWVVYDNNGATGSEYYWGRRSCRAYSGTYSGWSVGAGAQGSSLGCGANYPNSAESWMQYGPFSLANTSAADLKFKLWVNSETDYDKVCRFASIDGTNFWGNCTSGNSAGWIDRILDLSNVYTLGNLLGQPNVWIALVFYSDSSNTYAEGGYVDDIVVRKCSSGSTCPAAVTTMAPDQVNESSAHVVLSK